MPTSVAPQITRLTASIGAQVDGIDLRSDLDRTTVGLLRTVLAEHHVVVAREQFLTAAEHAALATAFGPILSSPVQIATRSHDSAGQPRNGQRPVVPVSTIEDTADRPPAGFPWHTDLSWTAHPPRFGFLSAVTIPAFGGDTMWASTAAVFDALSPADRERCRRSTITHRPDASLLASVARHHGDDVAEDLRREHPGHDHALVRTDPLTGREHLFLSPLYTGGSVGASRALLDHLHSMLDDPHHQMRWRWREGDVVIWDEASTCHRALTDHHPQHRVMRRCVSGEA